MGSNRYICNCVCVACQRICIVTHLYPVDASDYKGGFVRDLAESLSEEGYEVHVVTPMRPGAPIDEINNGIYIHRFPYWGANKGIQLGSLKGTPLFLLGTLVLSGIMKSIKVIVKYKVDIIHAYWVVPGGLIAAAAGFFTGKPVVATAAGSDLNIASKNKIYRLLIRLTLKGLDRLIAVSALMKRIAVSLGLCEKKAVVFPGPVGIDFDLYTGSFPQIDLLSASFNNAGWNEVQDGMCNKNRNGSHNETVKLLYVGNLTPPKRVDTLIFAMKIVAEHVGNANLIIVGEGEKRCELEKLSKKLGIGDKVIFKGAAPHDEIPWYMRCADIFVHCSESEGLPVAIMEAMASGLPVIASEVGGIPELISDNVTGYLVHYYDYKAYADKIIRLVKDKNLRNKMGVKGRMYAFENFSRPVIIKKNIQVYRQLIVE